MKKFFNEFKEFISRGNVMTMAVGIIIGGAFSAIVNSLVNDIIMPPISLLLGDEVSQLKWILKPEVLDNAGVVTQKEIAMTWGIFVQAIINFLLIAFALFLMVKVMNTLTKQAELLKEKMLAEEKRKAEEAAAGDALAAEAAEPVIEPEPVPSEEVLLLREIRDQLSKNNPVKK